jgi:hypothetical protein
LLGDDDSRQATPPDAVNGVSGTATEIAAGYAHTLAIVGAPSGCLCEIENINPNQVVLQNVETGGKGSDDPTSSRSASQCRRCGICTPRRIIPQ